MIRKILRNIKYRISGYSNIEELRRKGMKIGNNVYIGRNVDFENELYFCIEIGDDTIIAKHVHILAHDASTLRWLGKGKVGKVVIGRNCFIGLRTVILPNVTIGDNVIVGAGAVVNKNIPDGVVVAGNPARIICRTDEYIARMKRLMNEQNTFDKEFTFDSKDTTSVNKQKMLRVLENGIGFIN